jgi:prepilin-type N-terminal cleavage/methylation domain-containing protein
MANARRGFTLLEFVLTITILALLAGGVVVERALVRSAALKSIVREQHTYVTAVAKFYLAYRGNPGDFNRATAIWGRQLDRPSCISHGKPSGSGIGACDGNSDGWVTTDTLPLHGEPTEGTQFWRHLSLAGMLEPTYSGVMAQSEEGSKYFCRPGTDCPASKMPKAAWTIMGQRGFFGGDDIFFGTSYGHALIFGYAAPTDGPPWKPVLTPEEAFDIDTKMDDGRPGRGKVLALYWNQTCTNAKSAIDYSAQYRLDDDTIQCALAFARQF